MSMDATIGFSVRIFLPHGDPEGVRIIEKSNWTGCGLVFPRTLFNEVKQRQELERTGVYVLIGPGEETQLPRVYVGEGDLLRPRIEQHIRNKDFWTWAVTFTSKDQYVNKAHVQYLESRLIALAAAAKRCELDNGNVPSLPSLSEADVAEVEGFLANVLLCFPVLGLSVFESASAAASEACELILQGKGIRARGFESPQGFVVRAGGGAVKKELPSIHRYMSDLRKALVDKEVLREEGDKYVLSQDYVFSSPSTAAGILLGRNANGRLEWKAEDGRTLKEIQQAEAQ
jgi:hypothetical protein